MFELQRDLVVFDSDTVQELGVRAPKRFSCFSIVIVQELGVFELQRDSVVLDSDIVQELGVSEL